MPLSLFKGRLYWSTNTVSDKNDYYLLPVTPASDIELTGYALLIFLLRGLDARALLILRWLVDQSNTLGTYTNTQNTVNWLKFLFNKISNKIWIYKY